MCRQKQRAATPPAVPARRNVHPEKAPPRRTPAAASTSDPQGVDSPLKRTFRGRSAVERGARCAKFAASFHRGPWEEGDRVGRTGRHLRDAFARPQDGAPSRRTPVTVRLNGRHCPPSMLIVFVNRPVNVEREGEVEREPAVSHFFRPAHRDPSPPRAHPPRRLAEDTGGLPRGWSSALREAARVVTGELRPKGLLLAAEVVGGGEVRGCSARCGE